MTFLQIMQAFRLRVADLGGNVGAPTPPNDYYWEGDDGPCLWKNEEITDYLNNALFDYGARNPLRDDSVDALVVASGTNAIGYPADYIAIRRITIDGCPLKKRLTADFDRDYHGQSIVRKEYAEDARRRRVILPYTVAEDTSLAITVDRVPLRTTFDDRGDDCELDDSLKEAIVQGMMVYAYDKNDAETYDPTRRDRAAARFTQLVGPPVSASELENIRHNANWTATVVGHAYFGRC